MATKGKRLELIQDIEEAMMVQPKTLLKEVFQSRLRKWKELWEKRV